MIDLAPNNPYTLIIASPLIAAAGSLGYGVEVARHLGFAAQPAKHGLGALVTRTTSLRPRRARPLPTIVATPAGLVCTGWEHNPGLRSVRERFAPAWAAWELPVVVSIAGESSAETAEAASELEGVEGIRGIELPLAAHGAHTTDAVARLVAAVRRATMLPLIVKLPSHAADLPALARAAVEHGADSLALVDGLYAAMPQADGRIGHGRLCGPAIHPIALALVAAVCAAVKVPVIGIGGVATVADARAMLTAGATAVGIGAAMLADLRSAARIADSLREG